MGPASGCGQCGVGRAAGRSFEEAGLFSYFYRPAFDDASVVEAVAQGFGYRFYASVGIVCVATRNVRTLPCWSNLSVLKRFALAAQGNAKNVRSGSATAECAWEAGLGLRGYFAQTLRARETAPVRAGRCGAEVVILPLKTSDSTLGRIQGCSDVTWELIARFRMASFKMRIGWETIGGHLNPTGGHSTTQGMGIIYWLRLNVIFVCSARYVRGRGRWLLTRVIPF
jgi:hypothetical protein